MRSYPPSWTTTLTRLGLKRRVKSKKRDDRRRVRLETLERREMLSISPAWATPVGDFDGDGSIDRMGNMVGGQLWVRTTEDLSVWRAYQGDPAPNGTAEMPEQFVVGDFDGDGRDDFLGRRDDRQAWSLYISREHAAAGYAGGFYEHAALLGDAPLTWDDLIVGDFNGDGRDDVAAVVGGGTKIEAALSSGVGFTESADFKDFGFANTVTGVVVGDFSGDGRDDLWLDETPGGGGSVRRRLLVSDGSAFVEHTVRNEPAAVHSLVGDFDGDGVDEVARQTAETGAGADWRVSDYDIASRTLNPSVSWGEAMTPSSGGRWTLSTADVNGDGRDDLIGKSDTSDFRVSLSQADRTFQNVGAGGAYVGWWTPVVDLNVVPDPDGPYRELIDLFESVYNTVELELYPGLMKGPQATAETGAGNPWDQAALLVQRYEEKGYNADIAFHDARAPWEKVRDWIGLDAESPYITQAQTLTVLKNVFDKDATANGGDLIFRHAMVKVLAPGPTGLTDYYVDPSWKFKDRQDNPPVDLTFAPTNYNEAEPTAGRTARGTFDEFGYLRNADRNQLPIEWYAEQVQAYLAEVAGDLTVADLAYDGPIRQQRFDVLPGVPVGSSLPVHDGKRVAFQAANAFFDNAAAVPDYLQHRVKVEVDRLRPNETVAWLGTQRTTNGSVLTASGGYLDLDQTGAPFYLSGNPYPSFYSTSADAIFDSDPATTTHEPIAWDQDVRLEFEYRATTAGEVHILSLYNHPFLPSHTITPDLTLWLPSSTNPQSGADDVLIEPGELLADGFSKFTLTFEDVFGSRTTPYNLNQIRFSISDNSGSVQPEHAIRNLRIYKATPNAEALSSSFSTAQRSQDSLFIDFGNVGGVDRPARFWSGDSLLVSGASGADFKDGDTAKVTVTHTQPTTLAADTTSVSKSFLREPGEVIAIGLDANQYSTAHIARLAAELNDALLDGSDDGDIPEFLAYTNAVYWKRFNEGTDAIDGLFRGLGGQQWVGSGIVASAGEIYQEVNAANYEHLQFPILPVGLGVDLPNLSHVPLSARTGGVSLEAAQLVGWNASALEHAVIEEVANTESVSTMRGLWDAAAYTFSTEDAVLNAVWVIDSVPDPAALDNRRVILRGYLGDLSTNDVPTSHDYRYREGGDVYPGIFGEANRRQFVRDFVLRYQVPSGNDPNNAVANQLFDTLLDPNATGPIRVLVPWRPTSIGDWSGSVWVADTDFAGGPIYSYKIEPFTGPATDGGYSGGSGVLQPRPVQLPPTTFTNQTWAGDPVSVANGNLFHDEVDLALPHPHVPLDFTRHYDAQSHLDVGIGVGWVHSFTGLLYLDNRDADGQPLPGVSTSAHDRFVWLRGDGSRHVFEWDSVAGRYQLPSSLMGDFDIARNAAGQLTTFKYSDKGGAVYRFDIPNHHGGELGEWLVGRLTRIEPALGNPIMLQYGGTTNTARVTAVIDDRTTGRGYSFAYSTGEVVVSKQVGGSAVESVRFTIATGYGRGDDSGRRLTYADPLPVGASLSGYHTSYSYYAATPEGLQASDRRLGMMKAIDFAGNGERREYEYYANGRVMRVRMVGHEVSAADAEQYFSYDLFRNVTRFTNENGATETYHHRDDGLLQKQVHPDGSFVRYVWGAEDDPDVGGLMLESIDEFGVAETFQYYAPEESVAGVRRYGELERHVARDGVTTDYTYFKSTDPQEHYLSKVETVTVNPDLEPETTFYQYDSRGGLVLTRNPLGDEERFVRRHYNDPVYPQRGLVDRRLDPRGAYGSGEPDQEDVLWQPLFDTFEVTGDRMVVRLHSQNGSYVSADAVRIDRLRGPYDDPDAWFGDLELTRVADNAVSSPSTDFSSTTGGTASSTTRRLYGNNGIVFTGDNHADWVFEDLEPGVYRVSATWINDSSHDTAALYEAFDGSADGATPAATTTVDQTSAPAGFHSFETIYRYDAGGNVTSTIVAGLRRSMRSYDHRGNLLFEQDATGVGTQYVYDDLGRLSSTYRTPGGGYRVDFESVSLTQAHSQYDGSFQTTDGGRGLKLTGENFVLVPIDYDATSNTVVEFWYRSDHQTHNHGFVLDDDASPSNSSEVLVQLHGQVNYWQRVGDYSANLDGWARYVIPLGQLPSAPLGQKNYLKLMVTGGPSGGPGEAQFLDVRLYERTAGWDRQQRVQYAYHPDGRLASAQRIGVGEAARSYYDARGRLVREVAPDGAITNYRLDALGATTATIAPGGQATHSVYDDRQRLVQTIDPAGETTRAEYDGGGRPVRTFDEFGHATTTEYDKAGRVLATSTTAEFAGLSQDIESENEYDAQTGRLVKSIRPDGVFTTYTYDDAGRVESVETFDGRVSGDPRVGWTENYYDAAGHLVTERTYDLTGEADDYTGGAHEYRDVSYTYDSLGRVVATTFADGTQTQVVYDAAGRERWSVDELGRVTESVYDTLGRLEEVLSPAPRPSDARPYTRFEYDVAGRAVAESTLVGPVAGHAGEEARVETTYDAAGRVAARSVQDDTPGAGGYATTRYFYDADGRPVSETDPLGSSAYTKHDARGLAVATYQADPDGDGTLPAPVDLAEHDEGGRVERVIDPAGLETVFEYDTLGRVRAEEERYSRYVQGVASAEVATRTLEYDAAGRLVRETDTAGRSTAYAYDAFGRRVETVLPDPDGTWVDGQLLSPNGHLPAPVTETVYDGFGAVQRVIDKRAGQADRVTEFDYDLRGRVVEERVVGGAYNPDLDNDSNGLSDGDGDLVTRHTYDAAGNLVRTIEPHGATQADTLTTVYQYDGLDRLVREAIGVGHGRPELTETVSTVYAPSDSDPAAASTISPDGKSVTISADGTGVAYIGVGSRAANYNTVVDFTIEHAGLEGDLSVWLDSNNSFNGDDFFARQTIVHQGKVGAEAIVYERMSPTKVRVVAQAMIDRPAAASGFLADRIGISVSGGGATLSDLRVYETDAFVTETAYNPRGQALSETVASDPRRVSNAYVYDRRGRLVSEEYDAIQSTQPNVVYNYDTVGNLLSEVVRVGAEGDPADTSTRETVYRYDRLHRQTLAIEPEPDTGLGAPSGWTTTDGDRPFTRLVYDAAGRVESTINAASEVLVTEHDELGRVVEQRDGNGDPTYFEYNATGTLHKLTDGELNATTYSYDALDRQTLETDALGQSTATVYDAWGAVLSVTDREGQTRTFHYDRLDRRVAETWSDDSEPRLVWRYDNAGRVVRQHDGDEVQQFEYDGIGRLRVRRDFNAQSPADLVYQDFLHRFVADTSDPSGFTKRLTHRQWLPFDGPLRSAGETDKFYDRRDRLADIVDREAAAFANNVVIAPKDLSFTYYADGALREVIRESPTTGVRLPTYHQYDGAGRLGQIDHLPDSPDTRAGDYTVDDPVRRHGYGYDLASRIDAIDSAHGGVATSDRSFEYDPDGQVTGDDGRSIDYDKNGNRLSVDGQSHLVSEANRVLADERHFYSYDDDGRRTERLDRTTGERVTFEWDHRGRLAASERREATGGVAIDFATTTGSTPVGESEGYTADVTPDGRGVELSGNAWREYGTNYTVTTDTVLEFSFRSESEGEVQGLQLIGSSGAVKRIRVWGSQTGMANPWDTFEPETGTYDGREGEWVAFRLAIGAHAAFGLSDIAKIVLVSDDDRTVPVGDSHFQDIRLYEEPTPLNTTRTEFTYNADDQVVGKRTTDSESSRDERERRVYDGDQLSMVFGHDHGAAGTGSPSFGASLKNRYLYGPATDQGLVDEVFGWDPLNDLAVSDEVLWQLADHQNSVRDVVDSSGTLRRTTDYDAFGRVTGAALYDSTGALISDSRPIDFGVAPRVPYHPGGQDDGTPAAVAPDGSLELTKNTWKAVTIDYDVTPTTWLELEVWHNNAGEVHGVAFDTNLTWQSDPPNEQFAFAGDQAASLGWDTNAGLYEVRALGGGWQSYRIPVGQLFTGHRQHLVFVNDDDAQTDTQSGEGVTRFRNVRLVEQQSGFGLGLIDVAPQSVFYAGRPFDETSGTHDFRARRYDPDLGRFLTEDPAGLAAGDANLYRYVSNSAVNYVDPTGLVQAGNPLDALAGGYAGGIGAIAARPTGILDDYAYRTPTYSEVNRQLGTSFANLLGRRQHRSFAAAAPTPVEVVPVYRPDTIDRFFDGVDSALDATLTATGNGLSYTVDILSGTAANYGYFAGRQASAAGATITKRGYQLGEFVGDHSSLAYYDADAEFQRVYTAVFSASAAVAQGLDSFRRAPLRKSVSLLDRAVHGSIAYADALTSSPEVSGALLADYSIAAATFGGEGLAAQALTRGTTALISAGSRYGSSFAASARSALARHTSTAHYFASAGVTYAGNFVESAFDLGKSFGLGDQTLVSVGGLAHLTGAGRRQIIHHALEAGDLTVRTERQLRLKPEVHHIASPTDGKYGPHFQRLLAGAGLETESIYNKTRLLSHAGPHGKYVNSIVHRRLASSVFGLSPGTGSYRSALLDALWEIRRDIHNSDFGDLFKAAASRADNYGQF
ncbi:RHS repeat-associated core domain-containing protein [Botrimarina sp.]|uniref:RHS repeat-associated core domain-containing protein n=1 Tax=Botrimarina sp. TaxID=2795802 RepID=UPI0032ED2FC9